MRFEGKTAIVSGGASGIGAATARRFASEGANIVLIDVNEEGGARVSAEINAAGGTSEFVRGSVADESTWERAAEVSEQRFGGVDVVHSNAYIHAPGSPSVVSLSDWRRVLDVNVTSAFLAARTFHSLLADRSGTLIITSSVHALFGLPGYTAYAASKGALTALCRQLAAEYAPRIRVNAVLPGPVATAAFDPDEDTSRAANATAMRRIGRPEEIAGVVAFLASDDASFITGASIVADGGWSITKDSL